MAIIKTFVGDISFSTKEGKLTKLALGKLYNSDDFLVKQQLTDYFKGQLKEFNLPLNLVGTEFRLKVWQYLLTIPYGEVRSYKQVAKAINSHPRAVGGAIAKNPIPIVIPCHRVIASNGEMCGFSAGDGIKTKELLLKFEQEINNIK